MYQKVNSLSLLFFLLLALNSCALFEPEQREKLDPAIYYKNDICFEFENKKFCGVGVIPSKNIIKLKINTKNNIENLMMTTCHREISTKDPDKGLLGRNGVVKLTLRPTIEIQKSVCPFYFASFARDGKHAWGMLVVKDPRYRLNATSLCNGDFKKESGVSICESKQGLIQRIVFNEPIVMITPTNGVAQRKEPCPKLDLSNNDRTIEYKTPNRDCVYGIIGKESKEMFILYTIGYEQVKVI